MMALVCAVLMVAFVLDAWWRVRRNARETQHTIDLINLIHKGRR